MEPALTPTLIEILFSLQAFTTSLTLSSEPIFPGFNLNPSTPVLNSSRPIYNRTVYQQ